LDSIKKEKFYEISKKRFDEFFAAVSTKYSYFDISLNSFIYFITIYEKIFKEDEEFFIFLLTYEPFAEWTNYIISHVSDDKSEQFEKFFQKLMKLHLKKIQEKIKCFSESFICKFPLYI